MELVLKSHHLLSSDAKQFVLTFVREVKYIMYIVTNSPTREWLNFE